MNKLIASGALAFASVSFAANTVSDKCSELQNCAKFMSEILGENYIYDGEFRGKIESSPKIEITRENAEEIFTHILHLAGFTRVPLAQPKLYSIMRQRDARDSAIPVLEGSQKSEPSFPKNWDVMTLKYKLTHGESAEPIARTLRSFMPASARIIPNELAGSLILTDSAPNLKKCFQFIREWDVKPSAETKRAWAQREKDMRARMAAEKAARTDD